MGVEVESAFLPAGDVEIVGNGSEGPVLVGIEHKTWEDAIQCMRNGRFAEQARGMRDYYQVRWLMLEGRIRCVDGLVEVWRGTKWFKLPGRIRYSELVAWLATMTQIGGMLLWRSENRDESVAWLKGMNTWWTTREWADHRSHMDFYEPPSGNPFLEPNLAVRVAATLPGIGMVKAERVAKHFGTARKIMLASEDEWMYIEGVGKKSAAKIVNAVEGK